MITKRIKTHLIVDKISVRGTLRILQFQLDVNGSPALTSNMTCSWHHAVAFLFMVVLQLLLLFKKYLFDDWCNLLLLKSYCFAQMTTNERIRTVGVVTTSATQQAPTTVPFILSALSSSPFHCALHDGFGQTWWTGDMSIPLKFASLYDGQVFVWSDWSPVNR